MRSGQDSLNNCKNVPRIRIWLYKPTGAQTDTREAEPRLVSIRAPHWNNAITTSEDGGVHGSGAARPSTEFAQMHSEHTLIPRNNDHGGNSKGYVGVGICAVYDVTVYTPRAKRRPRRMLTRTPFANG